MTPKSRLLSIGLAAMLFTASPSLAGTCDLTTLGSTCGPTFGGAVYGDWGDLMMQPYETVRLDAQGVLLGDVPIVVIDGVEYREFYLNIVGATTDSKKQLSLDELRIYLSPTEAVTGYASATKTLNGLTAIYDMDAGLKNTTQDNWIKFNYALNTGANSEDLVAYIPNSLFTGASTQYVYLYSKFGVKTGTGDTDFEEWWVMKRPAGTSPVPVPEPATLLLLGSGLVALRRWKRAAG